MGATAGDPNEGGGGAEDGVEDAPSNGTTANNGVGGGRPNYVSIEKNRALVAVLADGKEVTVKVTFGSVECSTPSHQVVDKFTWMCHNCGHTNHTSKKRCTGCQSWRGGKREYDGKNGRYKDKTITFLEDDEHKHPPPTGAIPSTTAMDDDHQDENGDIAMGARLPKRNRTNLYSSLSPAAIQATVTAKAVAYAANPPTPQLARSNKRKGSNGDMYAHVRPSEIAAKSATPDEFIGHDGNLFNCRICLGVGEVVCCDGCPNVFHPKCLPAGPSRASQENDDNPWFCHECWENGNQNNGGPTSPTTKKPRKTKNRCSECFRKETKTYPCVRCPTRNCENYFHHLCPTDDGVINDSRLVCTTCKATGGYGLSRQLMPSSRGKGRGGRGGMVSLRTSSSEERLNRLNLDGSNTTSGEKNRYSSGFQAPYVELDGDDVGPESLAYIEKPIQSTPAFFFFLLHNRTVIEKSLSKKSSVFRSMAAGLARNQKVAEEGAVSWMELSAKERSQWVDEAMKDFEQRIVAWKEKEVIEAMIESMDKDDAETLSGIVSTKGTLSESDAYAASTSARMNHLHKVKSQPVKSAVSCTSFNPILLELLNDARFRPLPLVDMTRTDEDLAEKKPKVAVQQLSSQGPIETSLGDDCLGCTRGWSHFCHVLKRHIPSSEHRAKLQPPVSSFTATRIGLGLKMNLPREDGQMSQQAELNNTADVTDVCPTYQPRDSFFLSTPSLRVDDTVTFIELAAAIRNTQTNNGRPTCMLDNGDSSSGEKKVLVRGTHLPLRGKKKLIEESDNNDLDSSTEGDNTRQFKCGRCGTVQTNHFGCYNCQKATLLENMAKRGNATSKSVVSNVDGFAKPLCIMLGRSNLNDVNNSGRKKHRDGFNVVGLESLAKECWTPNVILPPKPKPLPTPKPAVSLESESDSDSDESSSVENAVESIIDAIGNGGRGGSCKSLRSCTKVGEVEIIQDRNTLALKHKDEANELSRKCLAIACCGILTGMVRRDPMRLFAEPVPEDVEEYYQVIQDPIDFCTMRKKILSSEYTSLGSFVSDARRLCINACVFNPADSLYAKTANEIYTSLEIMHDRAKKWMTVLKNAHASSFISNEDAKDEDGQDMFKDVKLMWPGAVELFQDGEWLKKQANSDFMRTRENEIAYYGALAIQRVSVAAKASALVADVDAGGVRQPVMRRTHTQDEDLRKCIDDAVAHHVGPIKLNDTPDWRETQLLKLLKRVQKRRIEGRLSSDSGCARCDGIKTSDESNQVVTLLRSKFKRTVDATRTRVAISRLPQSTGLASRNARDKNTNKIVVADTPLESIGLVATESMVSVRGSRVHGCGLFCDIPFKKGELVAEYIGEYVCHAVADLREKQYAKQRIQDYQFRINESLVIDATLRGGYARYVNHSCTPNCEAKIVDGPPGKEHLKRVMIISQQSINAGEELTYDYQFPLEMDLDSRIPCNCGSKLCRGFMNWDTPEKSNRRIAKISKTGRRSKA